MRSTLRRTFPAMLVVALALTLARHANGQMTTISAAEAQAIAVEAYVYAYPLVLSELTRRAYLGSPHGTPMNAFFHRDAFPDATYTDVVRPNADTLYSTIWFDVSKEPLAFRVPDSRGRYYLLPMLDMWSDVFAVPGSRTTGTGAQLIVLAKAGWQGSVPTGAIVIHSPTSIGWMIGRTQTNGAADYPAVRTFQAALTVTPLSQLGKPQRPPRTPVDPSWDVKTPPVEGVAKMSAQEYFRLAVALMAQNPPHANDYPIVHRMARIGIRPGTPFSSAAAPAPIRSALDAAPAAALASIEGGITRLGVAVNGWRTNLSTMGTYGTDYFARAVVAYAGLGANPIEDAIYPTALVDGDGAPFSSDRRYVLHFGKDQIPPVRGFWSLTMYDERQLFTANVRNRYAIGNRDPLKLNADGSLDLYIQRTPPGGDREANWLPAPAAGSFTMNLRLYWPAAQAINGTWTPPPVTRVPD